MKKEAIKGIDFNPVECRAMEAFLAGDSRKGNEIQKEFIDHIKSELKNGKDHCPCTAECELHGNCLLCVQVHRGHGNHLPFCMQEMVNRKIASLSELTEHTVKDQIKKPDYL